MPIVTTVGMSNYFKCIDAIEDYIRTQAAKGIVEMPTGGRYTTQLIYNTHAGTHREVILPEVQRLVVHYGCKLRVSVDRRQCHDGSWVRIAWLSQREEKDTYVQVCLVLCDAEEFTR